MKFDFYAEFQIDGKQDVDGLTSGTGKYSGINDILSRIMLLNTIYAVEGKFPYFRGRPNKLDPKVYATVGEKDHPAGLRALIHSNGNYNDYISCRLSELHLLGIDVTPDIFSLPKWSWYIEFPIILKQPFISSDDVPFYIIENPVRKDKVFGVPITSAMAWKGNLRWTMMKVYLEPLVNNPQNFAEARFSHTLLFGSEKGLESGTSWTKYLDDICEGGKDYYRQKLKENFNSDDIPHPSGMLHFYPTFWDRIDMEVINPHDRKTKTGKNPIYYEVVPAGARGVFRLLYVPFYHLTLNENELKKKVIKDLEAIIEALKEMMLIYGFSAKKSSGYGVIEENWDEEESRLILVINDKQKQEEKFANFDDLIKKTKDIEAGIWRKGK